MCRELGSAMSYTEFVHVEKILSRSVQPLAKLHYQENERPVVFQLYGDNPDLILKAALKVQDLGPDIIDINMGCPSKSIAHRGAGVGLMKSPLKIAEIFKKLTSALKVPVTGKMRLGWETCRTYKLIARIVEENGGSLIALHGRTKEQGYTGQADWDTVAEVKSLVKIPVVGSGDIKLVADIERMKKHSGCDAVMIGRGAIFNPWIFSGLDREQVTPQQVREVFERHYARTVQFYGEQDGQRLFRKHAIQYLLLRTLNRESRKQILQSRPSGEFLALVNEMYAAMQ
jgi:nifR3 family TIM-barrel protein